LLLGHFRDLFVALNQIQGSSSQMAVIVHSSDPVTLVGGADIRLSDLTNALSLAPGLVAADGGADHLLQGGLQPQAVIGDMDSISGPARAAFAPVLHRVAEQETTDFDKALRHIAAPLVIALGVTGGRFDHELAALHVLLRHPDRRCVVLGSESLTVLCPPELALNLAPGAVLSLFPMGPLRCGSSGLRWPTDGLDFAPATIIGTSNEATGPVTLTPDAPAMLLILPAGALAETVRALLAAPAQWPARAE
jgi:thiamine pyrophosphokinase